MEKAKIDRINQLARKARTIGLTPEEVLEQSALRQEYVASVLGNLKNQLDNTYVVDEKGNRTRLKRKGEGQP